MKIPSLKWLGLGLLALALALAACQPVQPVAPAAAAETTAAPAAETAGARLILATTTSTQDSGLLDVILPVFTAETGVAVDVIAVGTGQALKLGEDGNADVLLVHARSQEDAFMDAGHGVRREVQHRRGPIQRRPLGVGFQVQLGSSRQQLADRPHFVVR